MKIDFVILWVDGSDPKWLQKKNNYSKSNSNRKMNTDERYRDYDNLKYWFRAVAKYANWVNHIYLITDDQCPEWLNLNLQKVSVVDHRRFLKHGNLPVFNSNAIELNVDKIPGLSEHFVLFNDDTFINKSIKETMFFKKGLPRDIGLLSPNISEIGSVGNIINNNMEIINRDYNMRECMKHNLNKFFNVKYGIDNIRTLALIFWHKFPGFYNPHQPVAYSKTEFMGVREMAKRQFAATSSHKFRTSDDISHWLVRYTRLAQGNYIPISPRYGHNYSLSDSDEIVEDINRSKHALLSINDDRQVKNFDESITKVNVALQKKYWEKSEYEK